MGLNFFYRSDYDSCMTMLFRTVRNGSFKARIRKTYRGISKKHSFRMQQTRKFTSRGNFSNQKPLRKIDSFSKYFILHAILAIEKNTSTALETPSFLKQTLFLFSFVDKHILFTLFSFLAQFSFSRQVCKRVPRLFRELILFHRLKKEKNL